MSQCKKLNTLQFKVLSYESKAKVTSSGLQIHIDQSSYYRSTEQLFKPFNLFLLTCMNFLFSSLFYKVIICVKNKIIVLELWTSLVWTRKVLDCSKKTLKNCTDNQGEVNFVSIWMFHYWHWTYGMLWDSFLKLI